MTDTPIREETAPAPQQQAIAPSKAFRRDLEKLKPELERALASRLPVEFFARVLMTTVQQTPRLLECSRLSLLGSIMEAAQLGLIPDGATGYAYLVPYWNKRANGGSGGYEAQLQPGYKGLIQLAYRGGSVTKVVGREVCEGDVFDYQLGTDERIDHRPALDQRGDVTHFYACAWQSSGPPIFVVLPRSHVDDIREAAKRKNRGKDSPAWAGSYVAMGCKTAVRALFRWLPLDAEAHRVAGDDERFDASDEPAPREADAEVVGSVKKDAMSSLLEEEDEPGGPSNDSAIDDHPDDVAARAADPEVDGSGEIEFARCEACEGSGGWTRGGEDHPCDSCGGSGEVPAAKDRS